MEKIMKKLKILIIIAVVIFLIVTIRLCATTVPAGYVGVRTRFGAVQDSTISEGLNWKIPFIEKIVKIDCRTQKLEVISNAGSKDLQTVDLAIAVNYNVDKQIANKIYQEIGTKYENIVIEPAIQEALKAVVAQYTAEELITLRNEVSEKMQVALTEKIGNLGFNVTSFNITELDFSAEYNAAIEKKQVAEQEAKTAEYKLQKTQVENEEKIKVAETEARVMELKNSQITDKTLQLKELEIMEAMLNKWNGILPSTMLNDNVSSLFSIR